MADRKPPAFTVIEQASFAPYGDGKFGDVAHASLVSSKHDPEMMLKTLLAVLRPVWVVLRWWRRMNVGGVGTDVGARWWSMVGWL